MVLLEPSARSFTLFKEELALGYDKGTDVMLMTNEKIKYLVASMRHNQAENGEQPLEQRPRRILMKSTNRKSTTTTNRVRKRRKGLPVRWRQMCR